MQRYELHRMDCRTAMSLLMAPDSVDSICCDPPYGLSREPDAAEVLRHWLAGDDYAHTGSGFMGKSWDSFVPGPSVWREAYRVLKPGGYLLAFFGTRTYDLGCMAIRLAGFEIRDELCWLYGSGFPKSLDVSKQPGCEHWQGWGTALKPAHEPIVLARKPLAERTVAQNVLTHGTGGLNIDGCRVGTTGARNNGRNVDSDIYGRLGTFAPIDYNMGRFPPNVLHDGSDEVLACFPDSRGQQGDVHGSEPSRTGGEGTNCYGEYGRVASAARGDSGSAARFFPSCPLDDDDQATQRVLYCAKASKADRDEGLANRTPVTTSDGRAIAADNAFQRGKTERHNSHPTVKPTALMRWLVRLVTPPGGTVLDPFAGSGSTGKAALLEGFSFIGCEMAEEYADIAEARLTQALLTAPSVTAS